MGALGLGHGAGGDTGRKVRRDHVDGAALPVLGVEVVEAGAGLNVGDGQGLAVHHRHGQFLAGDVGLDHHLLAIGPAGSDDVLWRAVGALEHEEDTDRGALGVGLDHIGRRHDVITGRFEPVEQAAAGDGDAGRRQHGLGLSLVHGQGRGENAGVAVGDLKGLEDALDAAVLAPLPVQGVENDIGLEGGEHLGEVAAGVDAGDLGARPLQAIGAGRAGDQGNFPFGGQAAEKNSDVVAGETGGHGRAL